MTMYPSTCPSSVNVCPFIGSSIFHVPIHQLLSIFVCLYIHSFIFVHPLSTYLSNQSFLHFFSHPLSINLIIHLFIHHLISPSTHPSIHSSVSYSTICPSILDCIYLSTCQFCLSIIHRLPSFIHPSVHSDS